LPRGAGNLATHIAVEWISREQHLRNPRVVQHSVQNPWIMVVEESKARQRPGAGDHRVDKANRVAFPSVQVESQELEAIVMSDEGRVEQLPVALDVVQTVEAFFKMVRPCAHLREDHERVEAASHDLPHQIGAMPIGRTVFGTVSFLREVAHEERVHPLVLQALQELRETLQIDHARRFRQSLNGRTFHGV
jgi:hypothetical protein